MADNNLLDQTIAGRYRVISVLGEGAMGCVYLADDLQLHRQVALKVLRQEWISQPEVRRRLENECQIMARLGPHQHIVTLFDRLEHAGDIILVMEFVPGETLAEVISRLNSLNEAGEAARKTTPVLAGVSLIALQPKDAIQVTLQCLDALDFAHSRGILHRDIKPSNLMLMRDHNGQLVAKVMDFGIGKAMADATDGAPTLSALTLAGAPGPGTPAYMAPEQIDPRRFGPLGPHSDLYALGATLFEMLTMRPPFQGTYTELLNAHTNVQPPDPAVLNRVITPDLRQVVLKALAKYPQERYTSAAIFRSDLVAASAPGGTVVLGGPHASSGFSGTATVERRGGRGVAIALGLAVVACVAAGALFYSMRGTEKPDKVAANAEEPAAVETATPAPATAPEPASEAALTPVEPEPSVAETPVVEGEAQPAPEMALPVPVNAELQQAQAQVALDAARGEKASREIAYTGRESELGSIAEWSTGSSAYEQANTLFVEGKFGEALAQAEQARQAFASVPNPAAAPIAVRPEESVREVLDVWTASLESHDLDAHMACYGDTLETYFTKKNVRQETIREEKAKFLKDYSTIVFTLAKVEIVVDGPSAVATFDKDWDAKEGERQNAGSEKQRLKLQSDGSTWKIASEEELEVYRATKLPQKKQATATKKESTKSQKSEPVPKPDDPILLIPVGKPSAVKIK